MSFQLYATPLSHFARKVRLLLDLYSLSYEFIDVGNVAENRTEKFAGNPLMKVPALRDGDTWLIESDHIATYLVNKQDPADRFNVLTTKVSDLNIRAVLNGLMTEEVKVLLAKRTGVPVENYDFFTKALDSIRQSLAWLEERHADFTPQQPGYRELHLVCALDHLEYYAKILPLTLPEKLRRIRDIAAMDPRIQASSPKILSPRKPN